MHDCTSTASSKEKKRNEKTFIFRYSSYYIFIYYTPTNVLIHNIIQTPIRTFMGHLLVLLWACYRTFMGYLLLLLWG